MMPAHADEENKCNLVNTKKLDAISTESCSSQNLKGETTTSILPALPSFKLDDPHSWFKILENYFVDNNISDSYNKYVITLKHLPNNIIRILPNFEDASQDQQPYEAIKEKIYREWLTLLLKKESLGETQPSEFLRRIRTLVSSRIFCDMQHTALLREIFISFLPDRVSHSLSLVEERPIEEIAEMADRLIRLRHPNLDLVLVAEDGIQHPAEEAAIAQEAAAQQPDGPGSSRRRHPQEYDRNGPWCYYHFRFGDSARKCQGSCAYERPH